MEHTRNGDLKVSYEQQEMFGRPRNSTSPSPAYVDLTGEAVDSGPATARVPLPPKSTPSRQGTCADGELDVFSAERYFKGAMDGHHQEGPATPTRVEAVAVGARPAVSVSEPAWTRASSASAGSVGSANSQTVLLRDARRRRGHHCMKCCLQVGVLLRLCSGKRAVRVDGAAAVAKQTAGPSKLAAPGSKIEWYEDLRREKAVLGLTGDSHRGVVAGLPPNLNLGAAGVAAVGREEKGGEYTSASCRRGSFTLPAPVKVSCGRGGDDEDGGSESSSDLFEIKSLMIDDCPHEPIEENVQWSVVTGSAGGGRTGAPVAVTQNRDMPVGLLTGCPSRRPVDVSAVAAVCRFPDPPASASAPAH